MQKCLETRLPARPFLTWRLLVWSRGVYVKKTKRENKSGTVRYLNLAHNELDPAKDRAVPKVLFTFGREDHLDRDAVKRPVASLANGADATTSTSGSLLVVLCRSIRWGRRFSVSSCRGRTMREPTRVRCMSRTSTRRSSSATGISRSTTPVSNRLLLYRIVASGGGSTAHRGGVSLVDDFRYHLAMLLAMVMAGRSNLPRAISQESRTMTSLRRLPANWSS